MRRTKLTAALIATSTLWSVSGCSETDIEEPAPTATGCDLDLCPPDASAGLQMALDGHLESGEENSFCKFVKIAQGGEFKRMEHRYTDLSHHLVVYPTLWTEDWFRDETGMELDVTFDCDELGEKQVAGVLYAAQGPKSAIELPPGVGYHVGDNDIFLVEYHAVNTTAQAQDVSARFNLERATEEVVNYAGTLFFYNYSLYIPPMGQTTATMRCAIPTDLTIFAASSHMHARGVAQRTSLLDADGNFLEALYDTSEWDEPEIDTYATPLPVAAGSQVEFSCDYVNTESRVINEGPTSADEMCMAPMLYFTPKDSPASLSFGERLCFAPGMGGPVYSGTHSCMETIGCMEEVLTAIRPEASEAFENDLAYPAVMEMPEIDRCLSETSAAASPAIHDLMAQITAGVGGCRVRECVWARDSAGDIMVDDGGRNVPGPCFYAAGTPECMACYQQYCPEAYQACAGSRQP